jgi:putative thioredoxin
MPATALLYAGFMTVIDVDEAGFRTEVIERSSATPVVVDFWAAWCGPCRALTPLLERAANARDGKVVLAKVDTDANPGLASEFGIQGIPAVKAFRDGKVASEFVGAQQPAFVERFFDALVPSEADALVASGDEASLRRALELEPAHSDAAIALAKLLHERGEDDAALDVLANVGDDFQADGFRARIALERAEDIDVGDALEALDSGEAERAVDELIAAMDDSAHQEDLRRLVVGILDGLGVEHPVAREGRRKLAAALY